MTYLQDIETAANPAPISQSNFEEIEDEVWFLRPTLVSGVETTTIGAPTSGPFVEDEVWTDALLGKFICTSGGSPGTWRQITPAPVAVDPSTGTIPTGYLIWNTTSGLHKIHAGGYVWTELGGGSGVDGDGNLYTDDAVNSPGAPADMTNGLYMKAGVAPSDNPTDLALLWVEDQNGNAGEGAFHIESEDGTQHTIGRLVGIGMIDPTYELDVDGDVQADSFLTNDKAIEVLDTHTGVITSNDLAFPADANIIFVPAGTVNTVSGVTAGARYTLVATGAVTLTDGATIVCRGGNITLATNESVECVGLSSTSISVSTKP